MHIRHHLKNNETVTCVFKGCEYKSNVYSTFNSHKSRKHSLHSLLETCLAGTEEPGVSNNDDCVDSQSDYGELDQFKDQPEIVEKKLLQCY